MFKPKLSCTLALLFAAACGDSSGPGGNGGSGVGGEPAAGGAGGGPQGPFASCDAIEQCEPELGAEENARNSCVECAVLGDENTAPDAGTCAEPYNACFGATDDCTAPGSDADCCAFYECLFACDIDGSGGVEDAELDCFCTNEANEMGQRVCSATQLAGTCIGDHQPGFEKAFAYEDCVFGITGAGVCPQSCN